MDDYRSSSFPGQGIYEISVKGHLDEQWSSWFEGLSITTGFHEGRHADHHLHRPNGRPGSAAWRAGQNPGHQHAPD